MYKVLLRLKPYFFRYRFQLLGAFAALIVTDLAGVTIPWLLKGAINALSADGLTDFSSLKYPFLILLAASVQGLFRYFWRRGFFGFSRKIESDLRNDLFWHLQRLPASFFQRMKTGEIMSRLTNDLAAVREFLGLGSLISVDAVVVITASIWLMIVIDPWLTLWSLLSLPLISVMVSLFTRRIFRKNLEVQQSLGRMSSFLQENLTGIRVLKAYAQEQNQARCFGALSKEYQERNIGLFKLWGLFWPLIDMFAACATVVVLWLGGRRIVQGTLTLGELVAFFGYLGLLNWPLIAIGYVWNLTHRGLSALIRLVEILEEKKAPGHFAGHGSVALRGRIQFQNVFHRYSDDGPWVLENLCLEIPAGSSVGIVGEIGCGKSTIVSLLLRLYDSTKGQILVDGYDIRTLPLQRLRESIGYVPQDVFLFSDTLRENVRFGADGASDDQVSAVLQSAALDLDDRELPHGLDTILGERGVMLSGGQRQRVALARAMLRDAPILLLDDALSNVDPQTERFIRGQINKLAGRKTVLVISHRLSGVKEANQILYLKDGVVAESGTHQELFASKGLYFQLFQKQNVHREMEFLGITPDGVQGRT